MKNYAVIDIGGTNTRIEIRDETNKKIEKIKFVTLQEPREEFDKISTLINKFKDIEAIGISAPGPADYKHGIFRKLPNMPTWDGFHFIEYLKQKTKINIIKSDNDGNLMALAHYYYFRKCDNDITQFFTISTGFGAGLVIGGKIYRGSSWNAQEVAYVPVSWKKERGKRYSEGSLEYFSAGSGLLDRAVGKYKNTKQIFDNYQTDVFAKQIIDDGIETMANMIASTVAIINPNMLVFDGSVAQHNKWYVKRAVELAKKRSTKEHFADLKIYFGEYGDDSALEGAYRLIRNTDNI